MILVVANHVAGMGFGMAPKISSSMQFLIMFRMPLFFFVSGFLAYKAAQVWDLKNLGSLLLKKIRVQTIPTIVFFLFGAAILGKEFWPTVIDWIGRPLKGGYWFTIVLLYMFIVYYLFCYIESKLKKSWIPSILAGLLDGEESPTSLWILPASASCSSISPSSSTVTSFTAIGMELRK